MAKYARAVAAFRVQAAMERRLERARVRAKREMDRPSHWRTEEEYQRMERPSVRFRHSFNPFVAARHG